MRLNDPQILRWLLLLPALLILLAWSFRRRRLFLEQFCGAEMIGALVHPGYLRRRRFKSALWLAALACFIVAAARPQWGFQWEELRGEGVDIIIAVDVSKSMLAQDIPPDRLTRARHKIADLLRMLEGDRVGLVAFAGSAFLQCPLTLDYGAAEIFLESMDTRLISTQGTAIGAALQTSIRAFNPAERNARAVILITDGEDHGGGALEAAELAKKENVRVFTIGIGGEGGAPIPDPESGGLKKDRRGEVVLSKLDESLLREIAVRTGGAYTRSISGDLDLKKIYFEEIRGKMKKGESATLRRQLWRERFQWFLLPGLILLCLEYALRESPRRNTCQQSPAGTENLEART